jgi:PAS domain S-box-containing protein/diguanylate cyclase (GGDEF)-like protein
LPYLVCESCGFRAYSAAGHASVDQCPVCGSRLPTRRRRRPTLEAVTVPHKPQLGPVDSLRQEIETRLGRVPALFEPAFADLDVIIELWRHTRIAWLDSPVPPQFRAGLLAALAEYSPWPWEPVAEAVSPAVPAIARQSARELLVSDVRSRGPETRLERWPEPGSPGEEELLALTLKLLLDGPDEDVRLRLLTLLGKRRYASLIAALTYLETCRTFAQAHPGLAAAAAPEDQRHEFEEPAEPEMLDDRARARLAFEGAPVGMALVAVESGRPGPIAEANRALAVISGRSVDELVGTSLDEITHPDDVDLDADLAARLMGGEIPAYVVVKRLQLPDGQSFWAELSVSFIRSTEEDASPSYLVFQIADVTERRRIEDALQVSREQLASVFDEAPIGMALATLDKEWIQVNDALCETLGYTESELIGKHLDDLIAPDEVDTIRRYLRQLHDGDVIGYHVETRALRADDEQIWIQLSVSLVHNYEGVPTYILAEVQDISERKRLEEELEQGTLLDAETGLPSRVLLFDRLAQAAAQLERTGAPFVVMFVAATGLDAVEERFGHDRSDRALRELSARLVAAVRVGDTVARYGPDEFVIVCEDVDGHAEAAAIAERVVELGQFSVREGQMGVPVSVVVGMTVAAEVGDAPAGLVERADAAMQNARRSDEGGYEEYCGSL